MTQEALQKVNSVTDLRSLMEKYKPSLSKILPKDLPILVVIESLTFCATMNPTLLDCDIKSMIRAVWQAHKNGLSVGTGLAHIVPFFNSKEGQYQAQMIVDYKGFITLALGSGLVTRIYARLYYENEQFEMNEADNTRPYIHEQLPPSKRGKVAGAYAVAFNGDVLVGFDHMFAEEIEEVKRAALKNKKNPAANPWTTHEAEMYRKTVVRRMAKYLSLTPNLRKLATEDEYREAGVSNPADPDIDFALEGFDKTDMQAKTQRKTDELKRQLAGSGVTQPQPQMLPVVQDAPPDDDVPDLGPTQTAMGEGKSSDLTPVKPPALAPSPEKAAASSPGRKSTKEEEAQELVPTMAVALYKVNDQFVECPEGGEQHPGEIAVTYCKKTCKMRHLCFVYSKIIRAQRL